jgi:hypothetical protein
LLEKSDPSIEVIHIVREPSSVVSSLHKATHAWGVPHDHERAAFRCLNDVRISLDCRKHKKHRFVLYEDLVRSPEQVVAHLIRELGFDASAYRLENYTQVAARVTTPEETWKANNTGQIESRTAARETLAPDVSELIERELQPVYRQACDLWRFPA